jgi:hypothetical protein
MVGDYPLLSADGINGFGRRDSLRRGCWRPRRGEFQAEVLALGDMRGPAAFARTLYRETDASRELWLKLAEERKTMGEFSEGRPSKRDRRVIERLRRGVDWRRHYCRRGTQ